jgi:hypothetical protein
MWLIRSGKKCNTSCVCFSKLKVNNSFPVAIRAPCDCSHWKHTFITSECIHFIKHGGTRQSQTNENCIHYTLPVQILALILGHKLGGPTSIYDVPLFLLLIKRCFKVTRKKWSLATSYVVSNGCLYALFAPSSWKERIMGKPCFFLCLPAWGISEATRRISIKFRMGGLHKKIAIRV